jgi:hypothetical protein
MASEKASNSIDGISPDFLWDLPSDIPEFVKQFCNVDTVFTLIPHCAFPAWTPVLVAILNPGKLAHRVKVSIFEKRAPARFYVLKIEPPNKAEYSISFGSCDAEFVVELACNLANNVLAFHCTCP